MNVQYNPGTGSFSACGYVDVLATSPAPGTPANSFPPCDYSLQANISSGGVFSAAGSTLSISGGLPFYLPTAIPDGSLLLAGNLSAFDYTPGDLASSLPTVFRFLVDVTADPFNLGFGQLAGVLTSADNIFVTDFQSAFSGTARVDTFDQSVPEVPEPATLLLVGSGIAAVVRRRRFGARRS